MGKGHETRCTILEHAVSMASCHGLEAVTIGGLAKELGLSKSGLFCHFKSKENLQLHIVQTATGLFVERVVQPAVKMARGEPRVRALFENWMDWAKCTDVAGGCFFVHAAAEVDDRPGPVRDAVRQTQTDWMGTLRRAIEIAIEEGHFRREVEPAQLAFEMEALMLAYHHAARLLDCPQAGDRSRRAFEHLMQQVRRPAVSAGTSVVEPAGQSATPPTPN